MSGIFLKSEFKDLFNNNENSETATVSKVLNKYVKVNNNNDYIASTTVNNDVQMNFKATDVSATSAMDGADMNNLHNLSATSSMMVQSNKVGGANFLSGQLGGTNDDVDSLVGMLTSDSDTHTEQLETKLKGLLNNKVGGAAPNNDLSNVKHFFQKLKNDGVKVDLKLDDLTLSEFFSNNRVAKNISGGGSLTRKAKEESSDEPESEDDENNNLVGGRDLPPALVAFQKLRSFVAKELELKGIKVSAKVASALKKEVAAKNPKADPMEIAELAIKYFKDNKDKYEKMAKTLA
jgi:hypothetical protein